MISGIKRFVVNKLKQEEHPISIVDANSLFPRNHADFKFTIVNFRVVIFFQEKRDNHETEAQ